MAQLGDKRADGFGVQELSDGSRYEGDFLDGLKHGKGRYTWKHGAYYEGFFYKDFKHGDALYSWPSGHKFTGKFYLNRREGYGHLSLPNGASFQGLYHMDEIFGPGVLTYSDGRQDVGLWLGKRLLKLCTSVEESFSLKSFPEYADFMKSSVDTGSWTQVLSAPNSLETKASTDVQVSTDEDLLIDESFILPPGIEKYCTNADYLPLPPGRRLELDKLFYGELWEPEAHPYQGYKRDPFSTLPLQARMPAVIHKHRRLAENVGWNIAAVLSMNRESFGPKGPLEASSELLIQHSFRGEFQTLAKMLREGFVHPDVADSQGHTALIAATVNCHNNVIHQLLDMGADIDKLNSEGMSALAVCHVLYYPFHSLYTTWTEVVSSSSSESSLPISQNDLTSITPVLNDRPQTADTNVKIQTDIHPSEQQQVYLNTLNLLLKRGADPNLARVPLPVLFVAIMARDTEAVRRLLQSGARTDIPLPPEKKGLYPLHVAAMLPGPEGAIITELLLIAGFDPDVQACDHNEIYEPDRISLSAEEPPSVIKNPNLKEGGRTALHIACQRDTDYMNASKVVAVLLSHRASTDLLWSGHSPLSLAIASGNDLAVEELLNKGADPNIPLGSRVGSALCAFANINYTLGGNKTKLLDLLVKTGADILMPVAVGGVVGTAVDYAHYSFNQVLQDLHIAHTLFHNLNTVERKILKTRHQLLQMMSDLLRQTTSQRRTNNLKRLQQLTLNRAEAIPSIGPEHSCEGLSETTESYREPVLKFCYHCGRSTFVKWIVCDHCYKVFYCSVTCKNKGWEERHMKECKQVSACARGVKKSLVFESQSAPSPSTIKESKFVPLPPTVTKKTSTALKPVSKAEEVLEIPVNLKENYSFN
ncbi:ankyrin repeat and MYND domain-containing protein 1 [Nematolebias whitei]|uniref:ankyrin repeat and MYND domain-containing protein 1 n=1 Tax=Nematolebias whitei TaxID=451745 RepID=UPI0018996436|nr:ankyrin repeat and MYND domain-containing protein 1 [Nematolebias whitei]